MSETLRDLVVSLSLNSDNFTRNIKSINKQIQEAESAFRLASAGVENFETTTAGLSSKLSTLQRTFQLQQDAVGQYERALQQASDKLQECYTRQNDYAQRLADAKDKQLQLKTEVASAAQAYKHYKNTLGETDSATIAAKANLDAYKGEYRAAVQEVKKLEGQNVALKKSTQNAADAFSAAQTKLNGAKGKVKETAAEINQCSRQLALSRTSWSSAGEAIQTSQRSIASIGKQMKTAESSYRLAAAGVKDFDKSAAGLTAKLTLVQEKLGLQQKAVAEYEKALAAAKEQLQAAQQVNDPDKIREATDAVQDAETALNNARAAVKQTQADIASCNKELKTAQSEWTKAGKSLESFGKACDSVSKNLTKAGKLLSTTLTTPIVALGTAAIKSSIDFESSFTSVRKTVDATEAQFEQLAATSKKMSTEVAAGTDEINEVMAAGGQLGVATEHLSDFTRVMIDLGNSCEDLNANDAATTIAQFANIMGTSQSQFSNIGSTLVDLGNNFATTEKPIMDTEIERLLKKRQNGFLTEKEKIRLQELIDTREAIEVKYHLTPEETGGFETISQKVEAEVARAQARGKTDADTSVYENAVKAAAEGMAAINAQIDERYDKDRLFAIAGLHRMNQVDDLVRRDRRAGRGHAGGRAVYTVKQTGGLRRTVAVDERVLLGRANAAGELGSDITLHVEHGVLRFLLIC